MGKKSQAKIINGLQTNNRYKWSILVQLHIVYIKLHKPCGLAKSMMYQFMYDNPRTKTVWGIRRVSDANLVKLLTALGYELVPATRKTFNLRASIKQTCGISRL